ncbi:MAG: PEP-CTERM sorting domain-containing protein [Desmonostoc vinosum HA7617-LM4]|jgi:hypothetical protein|nr:PEP-CTERM sorting domain-containing protein [Desmonostoc vinosum HA7617-LM4]
MTIGIIHQAKSILQRSLIRFAIVGTTLCLTSTVASAFTIKITDPDVTHKATSGKFITTLDPDTHSPLPAGTTEAIRNLFKTDYPEFTYVAGGAREGVLTISKLDAFQDGTQGGLDIIANFAGAASSNIYRWIQYIELSSIKPPFKGAKTSPFTDPPPDDRDDKLPFYETDTERNTEGTGYVTGGNLNDNPRFWDGPRANNTRAPLTFHLNLFLTDFDSAKKTVTIYDGVQYGFKIEKVPEPITILGSSVALGFGVLFRKEFSRRSKKS